MVKLLLDYELEDIDINIKCRKVKIIVVRPQVIGS